MGKMLATKGQVCTETLELASHFPVLTNLTALRSLQQWPDPSWTRDKLREDKAAAQTDPLPLHFTPRKGCTWPTTTHPMSGHLNKPILSPHLPPFALTCASRSFIPCCRQDLQHFLDPSMLWLLWLLRKKSSTLETEEEQPKCVLLKETGCTDFN